MTVIGDKDEKGRWPLKGHLTELAEYESLLTEPSPLKLEMSKVSAVNSIGALHFYRAMKAYPGTIELHRCSLEVTHMFGMLGVPPNGAGEPATVVSCMLMYVCMHCAKNYRIGVRCGKVFDPAGRFILPDPRCPQCTEPMECAQDAEDVLGFLVED